jgi:hypothetical protein
MSDYDGELVVGAVFEPQDAGVDLAEVVVV